RQASLFGDPRQSPDQLHSFYTLDSAPRERRKDCLDPRSAQGLPTSAARHLGKHRDGPAQHDLCRSEWRSLCRIPDASLFVISLASELVEFLLGRWRWLMAQ